MCCRNYAWHYLSLNLSMTYPRVQRT
jgi:hypothetical protein